MVYVRVMECSRTVIVNRARGRGWALSLSLLILVLCVCTLLVRCRPSDSTDQEEASSGQLTTIIEQNSQPITVEAVRVDSGQFFDFITVSGVVRGTREVTIVSETSGKIAQVLVGLGERVASGQILIQLDSDVERYALAQARDQLSVAELELQAVRELIASNNSSPAELARATAATSGARSGRARAQQLLDYKVVKTPISGEIAVLPATVSLGNYIVPGNPIARVVDLSRLRMDVGVGERDISLIEVGAPAAVALEVCGDEPQPARVTNIAAGSASNDGNFIIVIEWDNRCGGVVKSGMSATVRITPSGKENQQSLLIPTSAIVLDGSQEYLYLVRQEDDQGVARRADITSGKRLGNRTELISGIAEGDLVIVAPLQSIEEGSLVEATSIGSTATIR